MNISINNFGPIETVEFKKLKELTFIYGKNNIGKSYAISLLYLVIKNYAIESPIMQLTWFAPDSGPNKNIKSNVKKDESMFMNYIKDIEYTKNIEEYLKSLIEYFLIDKLSNSFTNSYAGIENLQNKFTDIPLKIKIDFNRFYFFIEIENSHLVIKDVKYKGIINLRKITINRYPKETCNNNYILYYHDTDSLFEVINNFTTQLYISSIIEVLNEFRGVYYLPSSRSGLYRAMTSFSTILAELSKMRSFFGKKISFPNISEQDLDYFTKIMEINIKKTNEKYISAVELLERNILHGEVIFDSSEKKILYKQEGINLVMETTTTSSMVGEISPIVLYLKYIIGNEPTNQRLRRMNLKSVPLVFIEEPEAHLHPETQFELVKALASLVKSGCKLIITSHSNYIFNALNNLMINDVDLRNKCNCFIYKNGNHGCISEELKIGQFGAEDKNFINITDKIYKDRIKEIKILNDENSKGI